MDAVGDRRNCRFHFWIINKALTETMATGHQSIITAIVIDDYKKVRGSSRTIYYTLQLATVIFSGVIPILVLVDKLDIGISWFN